MHKLCNKLDYESQNSYTSNKYSSSAIISAALESMNANKFLTNINLLKLKMRLIIVS